MEKEFIIATRLPIPGKLNDWTFEFNNIETVEESRFTANLETNQAFIQEIKSQLTKCIVLPIIDETKVIFTPKSLVRVQPVWALSCIFAYSLCKILGGIVIKVTDVEPTHRIIFESPLPVISPNSIEHLESLVWADFDDPSEILKKWQKESELLDLDES